MRLRTHPGEILRHEFLDPSEMSATALAEAIEVPANRITEIVRGRRDVTADTAILLADYFGTTPELWMNLQAAYDLSKAEAARAVVRERAAASVAQEGRVKMVRSASGGGFASAGYGEKWAASKYLRSKAGTVADKSLGATALTQKSRTETTSQKVAASASKILHSKTASKETKSAAASALTQKVKARKK